MSVFQSDYAQPKFFLYFVEYGIYCDEKCSEGLQISDLGMVYIANNA
jgi:hypothetical protein